MITSPLPNMDSIPILALKVFWMFLKFLWVAKPIGLIVFGIIMSYSRLSLKVYTELKFKHKMIRKLKQPSRLKKGILFLLFYYM